ncbi:unnamed protein product [Parnassius mnemosyne]|uniref:MADF domain-containing protein n=2 Tax=Parnassius mnemosyne TaxID=213953 RepID=A0AAV1LC73_9NEOP
MANNITPEVLIPLVEQRAVLWDKTLDIYKDKGLKLAAWREICCVFEPNFDKLEEKERKDFATQISTKWTHIRDAFMRSLKNEKEKKRSGAGAKTTRPYVYKNQLSFLLKVTEPRMTSDSSNEPNNTISNTLSDAAPSTQKKTKTDTLDDKMSQFLDYKLNNQEHPHVSFKKGILPSLASFDNDDNFEFQTGIMQLIEKIKKKRLRNNLYDTYANYGDYQNHLSQPTGYFTQDPGASTSTSNQVMEPAASPNSVYTNLSDSTQDSFNFDNI